MPDYPTIHWDLRTRKRRPPKRAPGELPPSVPGPQPLKAPVIPARQEVEVRSLGLEED